jgi:hypothetical protein
MDLDLDLEAEPALEGEAEAGAEDLNLDLELEGEKDPVEAAADEEVELDLEEIDMSDIESMLDEEGEPSGEKAADEEEAGLAVEAEEVDLAELEEALDVDEVSELEEEPLDEDLDLDLEAGIEAEIAAEEGGVELETEDIEDLDLELEEEPDLEVKSEDEDLELEFVSDDAGQEEVRLEEAVEETISVEERPDGDSVLISKSVDDASTQVSTEELPHVIPTEEEAAAPKKPPKPVRKKRIGKPVKVLLILVLLAGGAIFGLPRLGIQVPKVGVVADIAKKIPFVGKFLGSKVEDPGNLRITTFALNSKFVENSKTGTLFVITGKARNDYAEQRGFIKVTGKLYTKNKQLSKTSTVFSGNNLSNKQLAQLDLAAIEKKLLNPDGQKRSNMRINPGQVVSFMIVFSNLPSDLDEFSVEVAGSQVIGK